MDDEPVTENNERAIKLIGALVKDARVDRGLSQRQFAEIAGVDYKTLGSFERGQRTPRDVSLAKIEAALGWRKGSIELELTDSTMEELEALAVADMEGAPGDESWQDLAEQFKPMVYGGVKKARELSDDELLTELVYRFHNYQSRTDGDSRWKRRVAPPSDN
jgi:transcriptional regulator with XRE-family HTH domain